MTATKRAQGWSHQLAELTLAMAQRAAGEPQTIAAAARLVQHAFGVCAVGSTLPVARLARAAVGSAPGPCLMFGSAALHSAQDAAFANAVAGHASLLEDSGPGGLAAGSHPGTYVFPAALAAAQECGATGAALLQAVCAAYECVDRLGAIVPAEMAQRGFRAVPLLGGFGAAAAAGVLWRLDAGQLAAAFGIAANLAGGLNQGFVDGTMEPYLHPAFAARNGLLAARLAQAGVTASAAALEGERGFLATFAGHVPPSLALAGGDGTPAVCRVGTKDYATCLYNQGTLALVRHAFPRGFAAAQLERVQLARPQRGVHGLFAPGVAAAPPFATALQRQMSARFTTAAALLGRPVDSAHWYEQAAADAEVAALAARIELVAHEAAGIRIELVLHDGSEQHAEAGPASVLGFSSAHTAAAFQDRVLPLLGPRTQEAAALLAGLPRLDALEPLAALFRIPVSGVNP